MRIKIIDILTVLFFMTLMSACVSLKLSKKNRKSKQGPVCPLVNFNKVTSAIDNDKFVFPQDFQYNQNSYELAKRQTSAARGFFYNINNSDRVKNHLMRIASNLEKLSIKYNNENKSGLRFTQVLEKITRQTGKNGSIAKLFDRLKSLYKNADGNVLIQNLIESVKYGTANTNEYLGFIALLGDIGAILSDLTNRPIDPLADNTLNFAVRSALFSYFGNEIEKKARDYYALYSPDKYYDNTSKNRGKKKERGTCFENDKMKLDPRSGILNVGEEVDQELNVDEKERIPPISWPWQTVPKKVVDACGDEPWAGHYSGSYYELITMQEIFARVNPKEEVVLTNENKELFASVGASFLIGTGMHSAVEVYFVTDLYLNGNVYPLENYEQICTGATKFMENLIDNNK